MQPRGVLTCLGVFLGVLAVRGVASGRPAVDLDVRLGEPVLPANQETSVYLKVSLHGRPGRQAARPAVNVCLAIDRSGSMAGEKIEQARQGALAALRRLSPEDTVSVVAYDDTVDILVPAGSAAER